MISSVLFVLLFVFVVDELFKRDFDLTAVLSMYDVNDVRVDGTTAKPARRINPDLPVIKMTVSFAASELALRPCKLKTYETEWRRFFFFSSILVDFDCQNIAQGSFENSVRSRDRRMHRTSIVLDKFRSVEHAVGKTCGH